VQSMKSTYFNANGSDRTYWDFFLGFGLFVNVLMLFASVVAWQCGGVPAETLALMRMSVWAFVVLLRRRRVLELASFLHRPGGVFDGNFSMPRGAAWLSGRQH